MALPAGAYSWPPNLKQITHKLTIHQELAYSLGQQLESGKFQCHFKENTKPTSIVIFVKVSDCAKFVTFEQWPKYPKCT